MTLPRWLRSFRAQLALAGFAAIYVAVLVLFGVTSLTEEEHVTTDDGAEVTASSSADGSGWDELAVLALAPVAAGLAWWWAGRAVRPIERIRSVAERIEATDLSERIDLRRGPTEVVSLAASFDAMLARLHLAATQQRQVIDEISHELRTPIAVLLTNADVRLTRADPSLEWLRDGLEQSRLTAERMRTVLERLLIDARSDAQTADRHPADLMDVVRAVVSEVGVVAAAKDVQVGVDGPAHVSGSWDTALLARAITNLLDNAVRHSRAGGGVHVAVRQAEGEVGIAVSDHGSGIPPERAGDVLERSWRGDPDAPGRRGLGLAIARQVARAHGGDLTVCSPDPAGYATTFVLTLRP